MLLSKKLIQKLMNLSYYHDFKYESSTNVIIHRMNEFIMNELYRIIVQILIMYYKLQLFLNTLQAMSYVLLLLDFQHALCLETTQRLPRHNYLRNKLS